MLVAGGLRLATRYVFLTRYNPASQRDDNTLNVRRIHALLRAAGAMGGAFFLLVLLVLLVLNWTGLAALDVRVNASFEPFRSPWLLDFFLLVTSLGTVVFSGLAVACVSTLFVWAGRIRMLIPLWTAFVGAELTTWVAKYAVNRARPQFLDGIAELNPSFPSGHATASTVVLGFIGYMLASTLTTRSLRVEAAFWSVASVAAVCLSRVFLSLHFLSDVLAGVLVGGLWLLLGISLSEWLKSNPRLLTRYGLMKGRA